MTKLKKFQESISIDRNATQLSPQALHNLAVLYFMAVDRIESLPDRVCWEIPKTEVRFDVTELKNHQYIVEDEQFYILIKYPDTNITGEKLFAQRQKVRNRVKKHRDKNKK